MGADGGICLYKRSDLEKTQCLRRIQDWWVRVNFKWNKPQFPQEWSREIHGPWSNKLQRYEWTKLITLSEWLKRNNHASVEALTLDNMLSGWQPWFGFIKVGELPGLSEELVRVSYGDNVFDEANELNDVIMNRYWRQIGSEDPKHYFDGVTMGWPADDDDDDDDDEIEQNLPWRWQETWT
jgi:hypothetical protein